MKTFKEALDTIAITAHNDNPVEMLQAQIKAVGAAEKHLHLVEEVDGEEVMKKIMQGIAAVQCCAFHAVRAGVLFGMQLGIEMERDDSRERALVDSAIEKPKPEGYTGV